MGPAVCPCGRMVSAATAWAVVMRTPGSAKAWAVVAQAVEAAESAAAACGPGAPQPASSESAPARPATVVRFVFMR
jgi:hypothetical protein